MTLQTVICGEALKAANTLKFVKGSDAQIEFARNMALFELTVVGLMTASRGGEWDDAMRDCAAKYPITFKARGGIDAGKFLNCHAKNATYFTKERTVFEAVDALWGNRLNHAILSAT